jgi:hypothetical protein
MKTKTISKSKHDAVRRKPSHHEISRLAHTLYEQEGRPEGRHLEHWFNAESMIEANFGYGESHTEHDFSKETA